MELIELKNTLHDDCNIPTLLLRNAHYEIAVVYFGKIIDDTKKDYDLRYLKVRCKPFDNDIIISNSSDNVVY